MSAYQFYLSDDALPTFTGGFLRNEDIIGHSALRHILLDEQLEWGEPTVKDLLLKAVANPEWQVSAARNPEFFLKAFESSLDRPDILIFDWDYPGLTKSSEDFVAEFLERTYCLVRIYTHVDKVQEIEDLLKKERFLPYRARISVSEKSKVDADALLKEVQSEQKSNFSYKFGAKLRKSTIESLEQILVSLGVISIDEVMALLNTAATTESDFKEMLVEKLRNHLREDDGLIEFLAELNVKATDGQALIDLIAEKLRNDLNSTDILLLDQNPGGVPPSAKVAEAAAKLWSYRLYYQPSDNAVRRGDIVQRESDQEYFVVISADCDLNRFWQKNYGHVNLAPAYQMKKDSKRLDARFRLANLNVNDPKVSFSVNSLIHAPAKLGDGNLLLPFVPLSSGLSNFLVFPKEIVSLELPTPVSAGADITKIRNCCLSYDCFLGFKRIRTISEPFLTPVIHTLLEALAGLGVPDYPGPVRNTIHNRSKADLTQ